LNETQILFTKYKNMYSKQIEKNNNEQEPTV